MRYFHALAAVMIFPAAVSAQTYVRVSGGAVLDGPSIHDFKRTTVNSKTGKIGHFTTRIDDKDHGIAVDAAMGYAFNRYLRGEISINYARTAAGVSGCIDCGKPTASNGYAYTPSKRKGATDRASMTLRAIGVLPLGNFALLAGAGYGAHANLPHTHLPGDGGYRLGKGRLNDVTELLVGAELAVTPRLSIVAQGLQQNFSTRYDFLSDLRRQIAHQHEHDRTRQVTLGFRFKLGKLA